MSRTAICHASSPFTPTSLRRWRFRDISQTHSSHPIFVSPIRLYHIVWPITDFSNQSDPAPSSLGAFPASSVFAVSTLYFRRYRPSFSTIGHFLGLHFYSRKSFSHPSSSSYGHTRLVTSRGPPHSYLAAKMYATFPVDTDLNISHSVSESGFCMISYQFACPRNIPYSLRTRPSPQSPVLFFALIRYVGIFLYVLIY